MAKLEIPASDYNVELAPGSIKGAMKTAGASERSGLWMIPMGQIRRLDGFNVRVPTQDYADHIESLARSIVENGFLEDKPLSGYVAKVDDENMVFITDGYSRLSGAELAVERGAELDRLPVIIKPQTNSLEDLTVGLVINNEGRPLTTYEKSIVVARLLGMGMTDVEVGRRLDMTDRYVRDLEVLANAPAKVRNLVIAGKVAPTEAIKQLRKDPKKAADKLAEAVKTAEAAGKSKATGKHVDDGADEEKRNITSEKRVTKGRLREKVSKDSISAILSVGTSDGVWWREPEDLDDAAEGDVVITESITISIVVERAAPEGAEDTTDSGDEAPSGDEIDDAFDGVADDADKGEADAADESPAADEASGQADGSEEL